MLPQNTVHGCCSISSNIVEVIMNDLFSLWPKISAAEATLPVQPRFNCVYDSLYRLEYAVRCPSSEHVFCTAMMAVKERV